ncbi:MAG TPA: dihydroorotate dehydrogenase [Anaerohalosphaeraceae bacterium]|jgi:dihydroorotate dehydrogenase (NAD+) catalytic subunit|nr:dihydroorotate dehydrogenase [Anaerohalosphaeraceae bacterium]
MNKEIKDSTVQMEINFAGIQIANPVFLASGTCGYADELSNFLDMSDLGGLVTKSITLKPRAGNPPPRIVETDSGMLNAIGLANLGLDAFIREKIPILEQLKTAVFVNVAGQTIDEYRAVIDQLAALKAIDGFELNISCPNVKQGGITFGTDPQLVEKITYAAKKSCGSKPLMVKLTPTVTDISATAQAAVQGGADALSLVNTFTAMVIDIETRKPVLANRTGGLSGPAIKPVAVYLVHKVYTDVARKAGIPILGMGGIRTASDAIEFLLAGASAVAIGTVNFIQPNAAESIVKGMHAYCQNHDIFRISELTGGLQ